MGLLDTIKKALRGKGDEAEKGSGAADVVDDDTDRKHSDTIDDMGGKQDVVDDLDDRP
jgi:hypothetical protein